MTNEFSCFNNNLTGLIPLTNIINEVITINDCDFIIRPRTEKGWTVDMVFNASGDTWQDNSVFYYWGISGATIATDYIDNNLSFSFTSDNELKWKTYKYMDSGQYKIISDTTSPLCTGATIGDFNITITFERNNTLDGICELENSGGVNDLITGTTVTNIINTLSGATENVVYGYGFDGKWVNSKSLRYGTLKIYFNGKPIYKLNNWEEIIPSQRGSMCPLIQVWGSGTTGCDEIHNGYCNFEIKEINYYEEPLSFLQINNFYQSKTTIYEFNPCISCNDSITGII